jgi:hypothetical protein
MADSRGDSKRLSGLGRSPRISQTHTSASGFMLRSGKILFATRPPRRSFHAA